MSNCGGGPAYAALAGHVLYVVADASVVVLDEPTAPRHLATIPLRDARAAMV